MLWEKSGPANTELTVEAALKRSAELEIENIVVASNSGKTAHKFLERGVRVVCVTHQAGFNKPGKRSKSDIKEELLQKVHRF